MTRRVRLDGVGFGPHRGGATPDRVLRFIDGEVRDGSDRVLGTDIFEVLRAEVAADPTALWVGFFGYAARRDLPAAPHPTLPDALWLRVQPMSRGLDTPPEAATRPTDGETTSAPPSYVEAFDEVQRRLRAGDSYEVNLTRRLTLESGREPSEAYDRLCAANPAPYAGFLECDGVALLSASPECFVSIRSGRIVARPIKGTTPRRDDPREDARMREYLATDARFRAENLMITDLMRNDLSQVCEVGSVVVPQLMAVESYAAVHQLVTTVEGQLRPEVSGVDAVRALFPAGSMTGAPKLRTMEIIDAVEEGPRGVYSGAFGWIRGDDAELSVVIRSLVRDAGGTWHVGTGGGVTVNTTAEQEWLESEWKLGRLLSALA